ncbi:MAG TPA: hypothetical protein DCZ94_16120 [Lentisphaeria bacterium]|nr:MAG: hypothetical protein A2X48_00520 [Lentisphaerae bacterium GWF2_49_21]HBC88475.1 hypothetical protein [Lentisphaeria bacterium]
MTETEERMDHCSIEMGRHTAREYIYPGTSWEWLTEPGKVGWSREKLKVARDYASTMHTSAVMVIVAGQILDEWGQTTTRFNVNSIRKCFLSALYGTPVKEGLIKLSATMADLGIDDNEPSLTVVEKTATVLDLLKARSGVYHPAVYEPEVFKEIRPSRDARRKVAFDMVLDPITAIPTVWSAKFDWPEFPPSSRPDPQTVPDWISLYGMPVLVHIPDHGFMRVEGSPGVQCRERWRASQERLGRSLGYDGRHGVPGNLVPCNPSDTLNWKTMSAWGNYENGGCCGMAAGHFIKALYRAGLKSDADRILFAMMDTFENEPTHSGLMPGYGRSIDWRTREGRPCGYNYLADNYYFLAAAMPRLGIKPPCLKKV